MAGQAKLSILIAAKDDSAGALAKARGAISGIAKAAVGAGLVAGAALGGLALATVGAASDLAESMNKVDVVFGDSAQEIKDFAGTASTALGQSEKQALEAAGTFGNLFTSMGMGVKPAADMSLGIVTLASDLASFNNIPVDVALEKLRSGLVGEAEPLRTLGVNLSADAIQLKAVEMGLAKTTKEVSTSAKAQAAYALVLEQTTNAQGDFARTSDGLANRQRILKAQFQDVRATIGKAFLPAMEAGAKAVSDLLADMKKSGVIDRFANLLSRVVTGAVNIAREAFGRLRNIIATVKGVFKGEWVDSDQIDGVSRVFGNLAKSVRDDVLPAIKELGKWLGPKLKVAFGFLVENKEAIGKALLAIGAGFVAMKAAKKAGEGLAAFKLALKGLRSMLTLALGPVGLLAAGVTLLAAAWIDDWGGIREKVKPVFNFLVGKLGKAWDATEGLRTKIGELAGGALDGLKSGWDTYGKPALDALIQAHRDAWPIVSDLILRLGELANAGFQGVQDGWNNILKPALEAIGLKFDPDTKDAIKNTHDAMNAFAEQGMKDTADTVHHTLKPALEEAVIHHDKLTDAVNENIDVYDDLQTIAFAGTASTWLAVLKPALDAATDTFNNHLVPAVQAAIDVDVALIAKSDELKTGLNSLKEQGIIALGTSLGESLLPPLQGVLNNMVKMKDDVLTSLSTGLHDLGDFIRENFGPAFQWLQQTVLPPILKAFAILNSILDTTAGWLRTIRDLINSIKIPSWLGGAPPTIPGPKPVPQRASMNMATFGPNGPTGGANNLAAIEEAVYRGAYRGTRAALAEAI